MDVDNNYSYDSVSKDRYTDTDVSLLFVKWGWVVRGDENWRTTTTPRPADHRPKIKLKDIKNTYIPNIGIAEQ